MQTRQLGRTDLHITPIGFGAWAIGGEWRFGWGPQADADSIAAITQAVSRGVNWIDTAPAYGLGHSEEVVARALADIPSSERPYVFTKCSLVWGEERVVTHDVSAPSIRREVEDSLRRLRVETIDLYQVHWPRWHSQPEPSPGSVAEAWTTLADLKAQGKVRHIGVSNFTVEDLQTAEAIAPVGSLQPPYSMLRRGIEAEILPYCEATNIGILAYSPMLSGLLTGAMTRERIDALAPGRLAAQQQGVPGTPVDGQPGAGRCAARHRGTPWPLGGGGGHRLDVAASRRHRRHRRRALGGAGRRSGGGRGLPPLAR